MSEKIIQFTNCKIIRDGQLLTEDLWLRNGKIIDPEPLFYIEKRLPDVQYNCQGCIIAPGFIDLQINGAFGYDFSDANVNINEAINVVALRLLAHGVTAFCPTLITSAKETYAKILPKIVRQAGSKENGATVLGVHLEGPFISAEKRGAHPLQFVCDKKLTDVNEIIDYYKYIDNVAIITLAPELDLTGNVIKALSKHTTISIGHSLGTLLDGERAFNCGANFITHLFNAMLPFHHRDPGLVGLLTSQEIKKPVYYGMIADGAHTHVTALNIAYKSNPAGLVLVTDAISAMGLPSNVKLKIGTQNVEVRENKAFLVDTDTLAGSVATMIDCVKNLVKLTNCGIVKAIECATLHPANVLNISERKGTLNFNCDGDFIFLDENLNVLATFIDGDCVWSDENFSLR